MNVGITILNQTEIMAYNSTAEIARRIVVIVGIGLVISSIVWFIWAVRSEANIINILGKCLGIIAIIWGGFTGRVIVYDKEPTGRYQYECTIDDSASFNDVMEYYNVIEQRGDIWILEDKQ